MYEPSLKGDRIKAQIQTIGGLSFGFGKHLNKLKEILHDEEDIYGYLVGLRSETDKWEIVLCTNESIYVLDKTKMFSVGYSQYSVKAFLGMSTESNIFRKYKVSLTLGKERFYYTECQRGYVDLFRTAVNNAVKGLGLPYAFDKTPFLVQDEEIQKPVKSQPYFEEEEYVDTHLENTVSKGAFAEAEAYKLKMKKHFEEKREYEKKYRKNIYLFPKSEGDGFGFNSVYDSEFSEDLEYFKKVTGLEPEYNDYVFLIDNERYVEEFIEHDALREMFEYGRKGELYLLKEKYDMEVNVADFPTRTLYREYMATPSHIKFDPNKIMFANNHIAHRFAEKKEFEEDMSKKEVQYQIEADEDEEYDEDSFVDFDIDFSKLEKIKNKSDNSNTIEDNSETENQEDKKYDTSLEDIHEIQENGKTKMFNLLKEYKDLYDLGVLTEKEFEHKKKEVLGLQ